MIKILAFETSTDACSVALLKADQRPLNSNSYNQEASIGLASRPFLLERFERAPRQHAEKILPMIESVLMEAELALSDLCAIAFGSGPGSFMGVRIATSVAQALAFAANLPVIAVSTLHALAQSAYEESGAPWILPAWDARMGELYWGAYRLADKGIVEPVMEDKLSAPEKWVAPSDQSWLAAGNAWEIYQLSGYPVLAQAYPTAKAVAKIALQRYQDQKWTSCHHAQPCYLRHQVARLPGLSS